MAPLSDSTSRFAFYGRLDGGRAGSLALDSRQLAAYERALELAGGEIVARHWDAESGRKALAQRGRGAEASAMAVPSRGGGTRPRERTDQAGRGSGDPP